MQDLAQAIAAITMLVVACGMISMLCTFPAYLVGRFTGRNPENKVHLNTVVETSLRRWAAWGLGALTALVSFSFLIQTPSPINAITGLIGVIVCQYGAFFIGFTRSARSKPSLVKENHHTATPDLPFNDSPPRPNAVYDAEAELNKALEEGYSIPKPHDDPQ